MAILTGDNIEATHYTAALGRVQAVLGNGSGQNGYGQVMACSQADFNVSANDELIDHRHWNRLTTDINTCREHQSNTNPLNFNAATGDVVGDTYTYDSISRYASVATILVLYPGSEISSVSMTIASPDLGSSTATATINLTGNVATSVTITNVGGGYLTTPTYTLSGVWEEEPIFRIILGTPNNIVGNNQDNNNSIIGIYNEITNAETSADAVATGQFTVTSDRSFTNSTRFSPWGGDGDPDDVIFCELDVVFPGGYNTVDASGATIQATGDDHRRHFFNSGGECRLSFTSTDNNDKDSNWNSMFNSVGTVIFGKNSTTVTGSGLARDGATDVDGNGSIDSAVGNYQLTTGYQTIFRKYGSSVYSANYVEVQVKRVNQDIIRFIVYFNDFAEGNPNFDERVLIDGGTQSAGIDLKRATNATGVTVPEPTPLVTTEFQNT